MRSAVDLEDQRIFPGSVEIRRFQNPTLNLSAVETPVPDLFGLALGQIVEQRVIDVYRSKEEEEVDSMALSSNGFDHPLEN